MGESVFLDVTENFLQLTVRILSNFLFLCQKCVPHLLKKLIKFTRLSRTVWIFAKKTKIGQNTENFHPWFYDQLQITNKPIKTIIYTLQLVSGII